MINLDSITAPFQESFWLIEKRWFVAYEYVFSYQRLFFLYTVPTTIGAYYNYSSQKTIDEILFTNQNYYAIKHKKYQFMNKIAFDVSDEFGKRDFIDFT